MDKFFLSIHDWLKKRKLFSLLILVGLVTLLVLTASKLKFEEDISKLIPTSETSEITNKVLKQVNFADKIVVYLEAKTEGNKNDLTDYASKFIDSLTTNCGEYISEIQGKLNEDEIDNTLNFIYENLPLFLDENDYDTLSKKLHKDSIDVITQTNYRTLISPSGILAKKSILKDPLGLSFIGLKKLQQLKFDDNFKIHNNFLITQDDKNLLLFIKPLFKTNETDKNTDFVSKLYSIQKSLNTEFSTKVSSEYYGSTVIAVANANQIKRDIQFTISIALTVLMIILILFYKKIVIPFILFTPTLIGGLIAVVFLYILKGKVSAISLGIGSVLLGVTLDYSLHILTHFRKNPNVKQLYKDVTKPILMSSITTAIAFLCLVFLQSEALQDLGIFAALSVIFSSIIALIFIPQTYSVSKKVLKRENTILDAFASYKFDKNKILISLIGLILLVSFFTYKNVFFDKDISKMNYQSESLKSTEEKLDKLTNTNSKSIYAVAFDKILDTALIGNEKLALNLKELKNRNEIVSYSTIGGLVLSKKQQEQKINRWNLFWDNHKKNVLKQNLTNSSTKVGFKSQVFKEFYNSLDKKFKLISIEEYKQLTPLFLDEFISKKTDDFFTVSSLIKVNETNYNAVIDNLSEKKEIVVIDRQNINETFLGDLKNDFNSLLKYSLIAVLLIVLLFFRSFELTLITIVPIALTWFITIGVMGLLSIDFNIFNIIISTFIFGLGVDYSIFITNGLVKQYKYGVKELTTYKTAILLSVITTILGVGVLIFAKHPALKSISIVSIIGIVSAMLIAFTVQPLLFKLLVTWRTKKGLAPLKARTFLHAMILFVFYGVGGMLLSLFSITILPLIPISKKKKMKWLHGTMAKMVTATLYGNPFVKKKVINRNKETFKKPAIIISNHVSFLDTLTIGMVTPNVIYLVNDWVYKSPVFGLLARIAGFYPVSSGVDGSLDHLKEKIRQGYCLVVFPEARRSFTNKIGRFHKGAFFLANELKLDILPLYLHGNSEVLPKGDFIIYDGSLTIEVGKRINYEVLSSFGETDRARTKNIAAFYKKEFLNVRSKIETENYFKNILISNFQYKGNELYNKIEKDFSENKKLYKVVMDSLPNKGRISHIADDYGQIDILLVSQFIDRKITSYIEVKNQRLIAANNYSAQTRNVNYVNSIEALEKSFRDVLLISVKNKNSINIKDLKESLILQLNQVIILNDDSVADHFLNLGFEVHDKNTNIINLKRKYR